MSKNKNEKLLEAIDNVEFANRQRAYALGWIRLFEKREPTEEENKQFAPLNDDESVKLVGRMLNKSGGSIGRKVAKA